MCEVVSMCACINYYINLYVRTYIFINQYGSLRVCVMRACFLCIYIVTHVSN